MLIVSDVLMSKLASAAIQMELDWKLNNKKASGHWLLTCA
jgi:hypothetical protein